MNKFLIIFSFLVLVFSNHQAFRAQTSADAPVNIFGSVSILDDEAKFIVITTAEGKSVTAVFDQTVECKKVPAGETTLRNATAISLAQIAPGDNALLRGWSSSDGKIKVQQIIVIARADIADRQSRKNEEWKRRGMAGVVQKIDPAGGALTVRLKGGDAPTVEVVFTDQTVFRRYRANASHLNDYQPGNPREIKEGDQIRILGNRDTGAARVVAEEVFSGSFQTLVGKVLAVDANANRFTVADLQSGKKIIVSFGSGAKLRRLTKDTLGEQSGGAKKNPSNGIDLTDLAEKALPLAATDVKLGETLVVTSLSPKDSEIVRAITIVSGIELLNIQFGKKSEANAGKKFNLDVF